MQAEYEALIAAQEAAIAALVDGALLNSVVEAANKVWCACLNVQVLLKSCNRYRHCFSTTVLVHM